MLNEDFEDFTPEERRELKSLVANKQRARAKRIAEVEALYSAQKKTTPVVKVNGRSFTCEQLNDFAGELVNVFEGHKGQPTVTVTIRLLTRDITDTLVFRFALVNLLHDDELASMNVNVRDRRSWIAKLWNFIWREGGDREVIITPDRGNNIAASPQDSPRGYGYLPAYSLCEMLT